MKRLFLCAILMAALNLSAQPLWLRENVISPQGDQIAFCYKGDVYVVAAQGGKALQLTTTTAYETSPVWSPDGRQLAFASDRKGNMDVFVMPSAGGAAKQLTFNSASETPWTFTPDGRYIYFSAAIQDPTSSALFPSSRLTEVYQVPVEGGVSTQVLASPAEAITFNKNGKFFVYQDQKGMEDALRTLGVIA